MLCSRRQDHDTGSNKLYITYVQNNFIIMVHGAGLSDSFTSHKIPQFINLREKYLCYFKVPKLASALRILASKGVVQKTFYKGLHIPSISHFYQSCIIDESSITKLPRYHDWSLVSRQEAIARLLQTSQ